MLNIKQEKFIANLLKGMSQREAYKDAYQVNYKDYAIDNRASELFNKGEVQVRYKELKDKLLEEDIMTAKERMKWLSDVVNGKIKHTSFSSNGEEYENEAYISDKLKAIDTLNKMTGEYTQKVEVDSSNFEVNIKVIE